MKGGVVVGHFMGVALVSQSLVVLDLTVSNQITSNLKITAGNFSYYFIHSHKLSCSSESTPSCYSSFQLVLQKKMTI